MGKTYVGNRLRQLRRERSLSQSALAEALGLSASYVNQIEHDQRPLTIPVLNRITETFGVDPTLFSADDDTRLLAELNEITADQELHDAGGVDLEELSELLTHHPGIARTMIAMHRRYTSMRDTLHLATDTRRRDSDFSMPHDEVRGFFYTQRNYFDELDRWAENLAGEIGVDCFSIARTEQALAERLRTKHNVELAVETAPATLHSFDPETGILKLAPFLSTGQRAFRLAGELAQLEASKIFDDLLTMHSFRSAAAVALARRGLASYGAAALAMPYCLIHREAEKSGYDIEYLRGVFGVGYETVASRLSTLQRPGLRGIPFTFVRVDRAGNMSKRQCATGVPFSNAGGTCPLWSVYEAFAHPDTIIRQHAVMPDGREYLWVARTVRHHLSRFGQMEKLFSIGLGCEIRHAHRTVYARGLDLTAEPAPIGNGCRICPRTQCPQRAFPSVDMPLEINPHQSSIAPY